MMSSKMLLSVGPAPHWRTTYNISHIHLFTLFALSPAILAAILLQPNAPSMLGVAGLLAFGAGTGLLAEYLIQVIMRQPLYATNGHAAVIGIILTLLMPPTVPTGILLLGIILAILIGKQIFGGIGAYPFHPAMVAYAILLLSYPHHIYPVGSNTLAAFHPTVIYLTLAGGVFLMLFQHIKWEVPLFMLLGTALASLLFSQFNPSIASLSNQLLSGHLLLAAFFILPDNTSSPANSIPAMLYGFCAGVFIILIRAYGVWPDPIPFAILLANILAPLLDKLTPKPLEARQ